MKPPKRSIAVLVVLLNLATIFAQKQQPTVAINGIYYLMEAEKGIGNKPTKVKNFEFGYHNDKAILAIAACSKCMPAVYTYQKEDSENLNLPVFFNSAGLYVITYDTDSFVMIMQSVDAIDDWTNFYYSNFYSKSESKANNMTQEKIKEYILKLSK